MKTYKKEMPEKKLEKRKESNILSDQFNINNGSRQSKLVDLLIVVGCGLKIDIER